jgi:hypothetical protein
MSRISTHQSFAPESSLQERAAKSNVERRDFRLSPPLPRIVAGVTAGVASVAAAFCIFGPFSDLSALQLAAGPQSLTVDPNGRPIVQARTGRSWGADQERRVAAASAVPLVTLARGPSLGIPGIGRAAK